MRLLDFAAKHESTFATVLHRTVRSKAFAMNFKLVKTADKKLRRLDGHNQVPKLVRVEIVKQERQAAV